MELKCAWNGVSPVDGDESTYNTQEFRTRVRVRVGLRLCACPSGLALLFVTRRGPREQAGLLGQGCPFGLGRVGDEAWPLGRRLGSSVLGWLYGTWPAFPSVALLSEARLDLS